MKQTEWTKWKDIPPAIRKGLRFMGVVSLSSFKSVFTKHPNDCRCTLIRIRGIGKVKYALIERGFFNKWDNSASVEFKKATTLHHSQSYSAQQHAN
jgi:hypothetical protein